MLSNNERCFYLNPSHNKILFPSNKITTTLYTPLTFFPIILFR